MNGITLSLLKMEISIYYVMAGIKDIEKVPHLITVFLRFLNNLSVGYTIYYKHYYGNKLFE